MINICSFYDNCIENTQTDAFITSSLEDINNYSRFLTTVDRLTSKDYGLESYYDNVFSFEGVGEAVSKFFEKIKKFFKFIWEKIKRFFKWIIGIFKKDRPEDIDRAAGSTSDGEELTEQDVSLKVSKKFKKKSAIISPNLYDRFKAKKKNLYAVPAVDGPDVDKDGIKGAELMKAWSSGHKLVMALESIKRLGFLLDIKDYNKLNEEETFLRIIPSEITNLVDRGLKNADEMFHLFKGRVVKKIDSYRIFIDFLTNYVNAIKNFEFEKIDNKSIILNYKNAFDSTRRSAVSKFFLPENIQKLIDDKTIGNQYRKGVFSVFLKSIALKTISIQDVIEHTNQASINYVNKLERTLKVSRVREKSHELFDEDGIRKTKDLSILSLQQQSRLYGVVSSAFGILCKNLVIAKKQHKDFVKAIIEYNKDLDDTDTSTD